MALKGQNLNITAILDYKFGRIKLIQTPPANDKSVEIHVGSSEQLREWSFQEGS